MPLTDDPNDPRVVRGGPDEKPVAQHDTYLVLSEEERAKGFVRPVRRAYQHVGDRPRGPTVPLSDAERTEWGHAGYVAFEPYPPGSASRGRYWTQAQLDAPVCGVVTTMGLALCETYARNPKFHGQTYCCGCQKHRPVAEFVWDGTAERVGS